MERKSVVSEKIDEMTTKMNALLDGNRYTEAMYNKGYAEGVQWALGHAFDIILHNLPDIGQKSEKDVFFKECDASDEILSKNEEAINHLADAFDAMGLVAVTGYYDPEEDKKSGQEDCLTGLYHLNVD